MNSVEKYSTRCCHSVVIVVNYIWIMKRNYEIKVVILWRRLLLPSGTTKRFLNLLFLFLKYLFVNSKRHLAYSFLGSCNSNFFFRGTARYSMSNMDFFTWYWPATHLRVHTVQILNVNLLRIDSSSSLRSPCLFNLMQLPSQYKQYPPYSEQQTDQGRSSSILPLWLPFGRNKGLHIGTLTTQYFSLKTNRLKVLGLKVSLWKHNTVYGIDRLLAGIVGTGILECRIALQSKQFSVTKKRLASPKISRL